MEEKTTNIEAQKEPIAKTKETSNTVDKKEKRKKGKGGEVIRFILVGILCTLIDFGCSTGVMFALKGNLSTISGYGQYLSMGIAYVVGFFVSTLVNFTLSRVYVFQNVDKSKNYNTSKYFWVYTGLSAIGFFLGLGIMELGLFTCLKAWGLDLGLDPFNTPWSDVIKFIKGEITDTSGVLGLIAYLSLFCIKTLIVLFYNYFSRKLIIFKEPKSKDITDAAASSVNKSVINLTYSENSETFGKNEISGKRETSYPKTEEKRPVESRPTKTISPLSREDDVKPAGEAQASAVKAQTKGMPEETIDTVYCPPQFNWGKPLTKKAAKNMIYTSLEQFDPRSSSVIDQAKAKEMIVDEVKSEEAALKEKKLKRLKDK